LSLQACSKLWCNFTQVGLFPDNCRDTNWGAPWLVRDILAARDQRLSGHADDSGSLNETAVEAPPPVQRTPAIAWEEFVGGYRALGQKKHGPIFEPCQ
jgi:hypothetical protein